MDLPRWPLLLALTLLTSACSTPRYWYEPPAPLAADAQPSQEGEWQGLVRSRYAQTYSFTPLTGTVRVRCATYADRIGLSVQKGQASIRLGAAPFLSITTPIDAEGNFYHRMSVQGDTWVWGGVALFQEQPTLILHGQLDAATGLGWGEVAVTPGRDNLGCYGDFRVSRESGEVPDTELGEAFEVKYWIDEVGRDDQLFLQQGRLFRLGL